MTYDQLYEHIIFYISQELNDKRKACLILSAFMEFNLDCLDKGVDPRAIDMTGLIKKKIDELETEQ